VADCQRVGSRSTRQAGKLAGWRLKAVSFLKNEATDLIENKGSGGGKIRNEATVSGQKLVGERG